MSKLVDCFKALAGTVMVLVGFLILAALGVAVMFVGYFLLWGIIGFLVILGIFFLLYAMFDEWRT